MFIPIDKSSNNICIMYGFQKDLLDEHKSWGGPSILMYTHYMKKPKYTYTLIYINIHKLSFYSALSVNHIMHFNDVFEELLHCINSFDGRFVDI